MTDLEGCPGIDEATARKVYAFFHCEKGELGLMRIALSGIRVYASFVVAGLGNPAPPPRRVGGFNVADEPGYDKVGALPLMNGIPGPKPC